MNEPLRLLAEKKQLREMMRLISSDSLIRPEKQSFYVVFKLLDQVEDVTPNNVLIILDCSKMDIELHVNEKSLLGFPIQKFFTNSKDEIFLVLEVTERHASYKGSCDHPFMVLHLLDEQTGQGWALHLSDEWVFVWF